MIIQSVIKKGKSGRVGFWFHAEPAKGQRTQRCVIASQRTLREIFKPGHYRKSNQFIFSQGIACLPASTITFDNIHDRKKIYLA
ncbi:MAG: hypothetical protein IPI68_06695 [Chitinophagaceae bacterium]|nr:hypothetical protein [Chitinophagaceae bacterium]